MSEGNMASWLKSNGKLPENLVTPTKFPSQKSNDAKKRLMVANFCIGKIPRLSAIPGTSS